MEKREYKRGVESKSKKLRSGYTTGACAAAAAKAATLVLLRNADCGLRNEQQIDKVEIPFPDGSRVGFDIHDSGYRAQEKTAFASVIKDAGDDPDVTNGAEIRAEARVIDDGRLAIGDCNSKPIIGKQPDIVIVGGKGVGVVTKPGLAIPVGEAAINPVPRRMIINAVREAVLDYAAIASINQQSTINNQQFVVTISVPAGEELAKKTLNHRLGIVGGISILGTTGIVKPLSEAAWTATITSSFDVAKAQGREEVVLSTGRTSEKAHQKKFGLPEDCYAMMGDYTEFSLCDAKQHGFRKIHLCAQWAKMIKIAMSTPQTHVRHGVLEAKEAMDFLMKLGIDLPCEKSFNTSREIYDYLFSSQSTINNRQSTMSKVCTAAKQYAEKLTGGIPVIAYLVSYEGVIVAESE